MVSVHSLGTRYSFSPCNDGVKVTNLLECEGFNEVGEKETELLDIVWMIVRESNDFLASAFRDSFSRGGEPLYNEWNKMICINLVQEKKVTELIKWHRRVREDLKHHMALTPVKA